MRLTIDLRKCILKRRIVLPFVKWFHVVATEYTLYLMDADNTKTPTVLRRQTI